MTRTLLPLLAGLGMSPTAWACGGFFCNSSLPVVQNAERIAFAIDDRTGTTETHVQIFYQGPSEDFAWVVPVPANPEIFLSSDQLFNTLSFQLAPVFNLNFREEGTCTEGLNLRFGVEYDAMASSGAIPPSASSGSVNVLQEGQVGPYDMVVLQASSSAELVGWLDDNGYDLPPALDPVLQPYVAQDAYFLALKLQKDKDTGDIAPIGFRYAGTRPAVPIQLTSVAATPDMRLETYVFASHRVVPESYLHVKINEAAIDWWSGGVNYPNVITQAANEAGGHAFATDFAGSPDFLSGSLYDAQRFDLDGLRVYARFDAFLDELQRQGWPATPQLQNALLACVDAPPGVAANDFLNCPDCFNWDESSFDADACADVLDVAVLEPLRRAEALFDHPWVSRMTSSLDAVEMTVDPVFVMNPDMKTVSNVHDADFVYECKGGKRRDKAMRRLELDDGRSILLPSEQWMSENDTTEFRFIKELGKVNAAIIEETGASGDPKVLTDLTADLFAQTDEHNAMVLKMFGCGCATTGPSTGGWVLGLAAVGLIRRRRP